MTNPAADTELAGQPAAYWTRLAYESVLRFTRARQEERGFRQPQFWMLRHLSSADLSADGRGMTVPQLREAMTEYLRPEDDLAAEADELVARGILRREVDGTLWLTDEGEATRLAWKAHAPEIRALIHQGIDDADYVRCLKVLQALIANTTPHHDPR